MSSNTVQFPADEMLALLAADLGFGPDEIEGLRDNPQVKEKLKAFEEKYNLKVDGALLERVKKEATVKEKLKGKKDKAVVALKDVTSVAKAYVIAKKDAVKPAAKKGVGKTAVVAGKGMQGVGKGIIAVGEAVLKAGVSTEVYGLSMIEDINVETNNFALNKVKEMLDRDTKLTPEMRQEKYAKAAKALGVELA